MLGNRARGVICTIGSSKSSFPWQQCAGRIGRTSSRRCRFSTTKDPSTTSTTAGSSNSSTSTTTTGTPSGNSSSPTTKLPKDNNGNRQDSIRKPVQRKPKESSSIHTKSERKRDMTPEVGIPKTLPVIQPSIYYYSTPSQEIRRASSNNNNNNNKGGGTAAAATSSSSSSTATATRLVLPVMNASALLDPLKYCKSSSGLSYNRTGVSRSIAGTDAARRLLRGKKDFILAARSLKSQPVLLEGHGVPSALFQHCIDMADSLLLQYSPDVVECTFHNYNYVVGQSRLPNLLRIRGRDATNRCSPWPPENTTIQDWDYHMELYLTVMERMAGHLGMVLQKKQLLHPVKPTTTTTTTTTMETKPPLSSSEEDGGDGDELTSSPFLFPNSNLPQWTVDILRGSYFDLQMDGLTSGTISRDIPPMPIVEFTASKVPEKAGHVTIRLQGQSSETNINFQHQRSKQPVTLVFDASFRNERN